MDDKQLKKMEELIQYQSSLAQAIVRKNPNVPIASALIIAGDIISKEEAEKFIAGKNLSEKEIISIARKSIGSFSRFDFLYEQFVSGKLTIGYWVRTQMPEDWISSDPDDTNPNFLHLWETLWLKNKRKFYCDVPAVVERFSSQNIVELYRGQMLGSKIGFSWTTDLSVAEKFAETGGLRQRIPNGIVLKKKVSVSKVYGYMLGRGESEVIVDPKFLEDV